jgi:hypothetical protein
MTNNTNLKATIQESSMTAPMTVIDWLLDSDPGYPLAGASRSHGRLA